MKPFALKLRLQLVVVMITILLILLYTRNSYGASRCPQFMIVLDRSGSMDEKQVGAKYLINTRWEIAGISIKEILNKYGDNTPFGFTFFPGGADNGGYELGDTRVGDNCYSGYAVFSPQSKSQDVIFHALDILTPVGGTPIPSTLELFKSYIPFEDQIFDNYIILITDGEPSCGDGGVRETVIIIEELRLKGIKTIVIGFNVAGLRAMSINESLDEMAYAGGLTNPVGDHYYYPADSSEELVNTLTDIISNVQQATIPGLCVNRSDSGPPMKLPPPMTYEPDHHISRGCEFSARRATGSFLFISLITLLLYIITQRIERN